MEAAETIRLANERVTIIHALQETGVAISDYVSTSSKMYCPFGAVYHLDGGMEKALRVYPNTNSAYCFAGCGYLNPVKVTALHRDLSEFAAAEVLLEESGYVPPDFESQWDALVNEKPVVNTADLAEALKVACSRMSPDWDNIQFDSEVSLALSRCLGVLVKVQTQEEASRWLETTKTVMRRAIGARHE